MYKLATANATESSNLSSTRGDGGPEAPVHFLGVLPIASLPHTARFAQKVAWGESGGAEPPQKTHTG